MTWFKVILTDAGLVILMLMAKLTPRRVRNSIFDWIFEPVEYSALQKNKIAIVHKTENMQTNIRSSLNDEG